MTQEQVLNQLHSLGFKDEDVEPSPILSYAIRNYESPNHVSVHGISFYIKNGMFRFFYDSNYNHFQFLSEDSTLRFTEPNIENIADMIVLYG